MASEITENTRLELIGKKFNRLTVFEFSHVDKYYEKYWCCQCDCSPNSWKIVRGSSLKSGHTKSCGCLFKEASRTNNYRHGKYKSAEYVAWQCMRQRCSNPKTSGYHRYGGRGIRVSDEFESSFEKFLSHVGPRPKGTSLGRIDNDGNYEAGNVQWETKAQQSRNRIDTVYLEIDGKKMVLKDWCRLLQVNTGTIWRRVHAGMTATEAVLMSYRKKVPADV